MSQIIASDDSVGTVDATRVDHGRIDRLDGIRTLAVLCVFLHHSGAFKAGWIGVWLFFALSGMLITGILRRDRGNEFFWGPFYIKRATRILPPLPIAFAIAAAFFVIPWRKIALPYLFFGANFSLAFHREYSEGLIVLWSLAIEEQFYLVWPFAVRYLSRKHLIWLLVAILAIEPIARAVCTPLFPDYWAIYVLTPFQIDGLSAGALLALLLEDPAVARRLRSWSGPAFMSALLLLVVFSFFPAFHRNANSVVYNSLGYSLLILVSTAFLSYVLLKESSLVSKFLGLRMMTAVGTMSYGFYLFHLSLMQLTNRWGVRLGFHHPEQLNLISIAPALLLSWLSFYFYEKPVTAWGRRKAKLLQVAALGRHAARA